VIRNLGGVVSDAVAEKVIAGNAAKLYGINLPLTAGALPG
jgi:hypothetical protein